VEDNGEVERLRECSLTDTGDEDFDPNVAIRVYDVAFSERFLLLLLYLLQPELISRSEYARYASIQKF
jgi:hypothetical protein